MQKKIAVFFTRSGAMTYPFTKPEYLRSYQELNAAISDLGGDFYITRGQDTYLGAGSFSNSWQFNSEGVAEEAGPITVDVIYDKGPFIPDEKVAVLNSTEVNAVCTDKWKTYQLFGDFCPKTVLLDSQDDFESALESIDTKRKVVKPLAGAEGFDVHIGTTAELRETKLQYPVLVQAFLDSTAGIPGLTPGIHDFLISILNGEIVYAFLRTPPPGELKANVALGGTLLVIPKEEIPEPFMKVAKEVDSVMSSFGNRLYGVDMAMTPDGPKIIELNSSLGLQQNARHPVFSVYKQKLAKTLMEM